MDLFVRFLIYYKLDQHRVSNTGILRMDDAHWGSVKMQRKIYL